MGSCKETNRSVCREFQFQRAAITSNDHNLCAFLSDIRTGCRLRLTLYREFVGCGGPIIIEEILEIDFLASLFLLRPRQMTTLHLDLQAHLRCRSDVSTYEQNLGSLLSEETRGIRAFGWCPGQVVFPLQVSLLISYKQPQRILHPWDVFQCDFCMLPEMNGMDLD